VNRNRGYLFFILSYSLLSLGLLFVTLNYEYNEETFIATFCSIYESNRLFKFSNLDGSIVKVLILLNILILPMLYRFLVTEKIFCSEFFTLLLAIILSAQLLLVSNDMLFAFLSIELQSLCFYAIAGFNRTSINSNKAGTSYFLLGSITTVFFLIGSGFIYATVGTLNFDDIYIATHVRLVDTLFSTIFFVGSFLIILVLLIKLAITPFHFWAVDVYDSAPNAATVVFLLLPKLPLFYFLIKFICVTHFYNFPFTSEFFLFFGIASIAWGSILAISQARFKRFLIYSSNSQIGFVLLAISSGMFSTIHTNFFSYKGAYTFLVVYLLTSSLIWSGFSFLSLLNTQRGTSLRLSISLANLSNFACWDTTREWKILALLFACPLLSFAGIPPFVGFIAKLEVIKTLFFQPELIGKLSSILVVLLSAVSAFYYMRTIKILFFDVKTLFKGKKLKSSICSFRFYDTVLLDYFCLSLLFVLFFNFKFLNFFFETLIFGISFR
jgi:proton-translocating NADH-quinone oxidoreductase chain N